MAKKDDSSDYSSEFPRPESRVYNRMLADEKTRKKDLKRSKTYNKYFIIPLYKIGLLPLLGLGRFGLRLQHKGRKTGKKRTTPVGYYRRDGVIHIISGRGEKADWLKNIRANPNDVYVQVGFRKYHAKVEIVDDLSERQNFWRWFIKKHQKAAKSFVGWDPKRDNPETTDLSFLIENLPVVRLHRSTQ